MKNRIILMGVAILMATSIFAQVEDPVKWTFSVDNVVGQEAELVDVLAIQVRPETAEFGIAFLPSHQRYHIPGSHWLPNIGYGSLEPPMERYFSGQLDRLTKGNRDAPLVFYCITDCWMSWNAIKRAHSIGYRNLYWYPDGTDGWAEAGLPLEPGEPVPLDPAELDKYPHRNICNYY